MFTPQMGVSVALNQADIPPKGCVITAVIRKGELLIPRGDLVLLADDEVLSVIHSSRIALLADILGQGEGRKESCQT